MRFLNILSKHNRYGPGPLAEIDAKLAEEGWAIGSSVLSVVLDCYSAALDGDRDLAEAQLASLFSALIKEDMTGA